MFSAGMSLKLLQVPCNLQFNPKEDYKQAVKRWQEVTGQTEEKFNEYFTKAVQAGEETVEKVSLLELANVVSHS